MVWVWGGPAPLVRVRVTAAPGAAELIAADSAVASVISWLPTLVITSLARVERGDKGGRRRTILLDDPVLVTALRRYLKVRGYRHGPLFRAEKNHIGGPLRYASVQQLWAKYRQKAQVQASIHQLRHAHATELVNAGVSLETIRRRLGHANAQTVLRYANQHDATTDAEIRFWRRRRTTGRSEN